MNVGGRVLERVEAREEFVGLTGRTSIPVMVVDGQVVAGFDKAKLQALLA